MLKPDGKKLIGPPISVTEILQLTNLGIPLEHITWPRVTMISDQWICIRHSSHLKSKQYSKKTEKEYSKGTSVITVLNPHCSQPETWESSANCAKMSPTEPLITLRAATVFQVYNVETRRCLCKFRMVHPVHYWTWINSSIIAIITESSVYHWNIKEGTEPSIVFTRHIRLSNTQLVNYTSDPGMKWFALTGLFAEDNRVVGVTQLFSVNHNQTQVIESHSVHFTFYQFRGNSQPSCVLIAATRGTERSGKLHIVELGPQLPGNLSLTFHTDIIEFKDLWGQYDFVASIQVSTMGLVYLTTKYGLFHLFDIETGAALCSYTVCPDIVFTTVLKKETQGMLAISRNGQVLSVDLKKDHLVQYIQEVSKKPHIAERLSGVLQNIVISQ